MSDKLSNKRTRKQKIESAISNLVSDFLYCDRKEDEDLPRGSIEDAVRNDEITIGEMVVLFERELRKDIFG